MAKEVVKGGATALKGAKTAATIGKSVGKIAGKPKLWAKLGQGALKGLKLGKTIPFLGTAIGAGFAAMQAWEIYKKVRAGEKVSPSDYAKMAMELGSMIPGVGSFVAAIDVGAELTGGYEKMDSMMASDAKSMPTLGGDGVPPDGGKVIPETAFDMPTSAPDFGGERGKPSLASGGMPGGGGGRSTATGGITGAGTAEMEFMPSSMGGDGTVVVKMRNFLPAISMANRMLQSATNKS